MLIDLSQPLTDRMSVYPGDPPVIVEQVSGFPADSWQLTRLELGCHAGTHVDAPRHFLPSGATLEQMALDRFCGPARLVRLAPDAQGCIDACGLDAADVRPGECLLIRTGWQPGPGRPLSECPVFTPGSGKHLAGLGIRLLALDLPTVASADECVPGAMHRVLLEAGIVIVENLANLDRLAEVLSSGMAGCGSVDGTGGTDGADGADDADRRLFEFFAVPLLIPGSEASPVRAFARLPICNAGGDRL